MKPVGRKGNNLGLSTNEPVNWLCGACGQPFRHDHNRASHSPRRGAPGLCITLWRVASWLKLLADDFDRDRELDVAVQLGSHCVSTECLDGIHVEVLAVDDDLGLLLDRVCDIGHRD